MSATQAHAGGRYRLDSRIATGGMGEVWRSTDTLLDRDVAVKVLKEEYADDPLLRGRFVSEARHAAALHHPNVASVFDFGEALDADTARPFLVMEIVPGQPLSDLLRGGLPMPPQTAAGLVAQAADAIAAAHALGIVHRDVKPGNLLVTPEGLVKITDFGIARAADGASITQTGQIVGTPHYISPEQAEGHAATQASDIYALGVVLYECLAGHRPFQHDTPIQVALAHLREEVPPLPASVPEWLREIASRALSKSPQDRFASAADMAAALRGRPVAAAAPVVAPPVDDPVTTVMEAPVDDDRRRGVPPWWPWAGAAAAALAVVVGTSLLSGATPAETATVASDRTSASPSAVRSSADSGVRVVAARYLGRPAAPVADELRELGLEVERLVVPATAASQQQGTVAGVRPRGVVERGTLVTLRVWGQYVAPPPSGGTSGDGGGDGGKGTTGKGEKKSSGKAKGKGKP